MCSSTRPKSVPPPPPRRSERRRHERVELLAQVEVRGASDVHVVPARNISLGGILLEVQEDEATCLTRGAQVSIFLCVDEVQLNTTAEVVRIQPATENEPRCAGLQWTSDDPGDVARLAQILAAAKRVD